MELAAGLALLALLALRGARDGLLGSVVIARLVGRAVGALAAAVA